MIAFAYSYQNIVLQATKKLIITTEGPSSPVQSSPQAPHQILSTKEHQLLNCEKAFTWHRQ